MAYRGLLFCKEVCPAVFSLSVLDEKALASFDFVYPVDQEALAWLAQRDKAGFPSVVCAMPEIELLEFPTKETRFVVDVFSQKDRGVLFALPREESSGASGYKASPTTAFEALPLAQDLCVRHGLSGVWSFTVEQTPQGFCPVRLFPFLEDSSLFSQTAGPNLPLLSLYDAAGYVLDVPVWQEAMPVCCCDGLWRVEDRSFDALYVDLDETLLLRGQVYAPLVALIRQAQRESIPVTLLTKHPYDVNETLAAFDLQALFTTVSQLSPDPGLSKGAFISGERPLLFDDSYVEKKQAHAVNPKVRCLDAALAACFLSDKEGSP